MRIAETIVHGGHASGAAIAKIGGLDGSGFASEDGQAIASHMDREIDKDINAVGTDLRGRLFVGERRDFPPMIAQRLKLGGEGVGRNDSAVAENLEERMVVLSKERKEIFSDDMPAKIG